MLREWFAMANAKKKTAAVPTVGKSNDQEAADKLLAEADDTAGAAPTRLGYLGDLGKYWAKKTNRFSRA